MGCAADAHAYAIGAAVRHRRTRSDDVGATVAVQAGQCGVLHRGGGGVDHRVVLSDGPKEGCTVDAAGAHEDAAREARVGEGFALGECRPFDVGVGPVAGDDGRSVPHVEASLGVRGAFEGQLSCDHEAALVGADAVARGRGDLEAVGPDLGAGLGVKTASEAVNFDIPERQPARIDREGRTPHTRRRGAFEA